ncbi:elongation factor Tu GTP binding domain-containing protein [Toxoplasma gondii VAND]|uniref:Elongation factor Tu GTP binding domain-containing protein n=2 Tax=Toxoplasma gondii TaxID=5811 RepID=A0A086JHA5_TOXGO|nr:elongation factor Tu GTP binding domain-containing protein [Toxoplasma gondii p89]KFH01245.1 elongation factor Tu GTP binding domain-containing protein [Toxoplasma gondii VAND]
MERVKCCCGNPIYANVGVLGHVDSGKTSLARVLTAVRSTASLDKHPQSQERGITIDLGFSAFTLALDIDSRPGEGASPASSPEATVPSRAEFEKNEKREATDLDTPGSEPSADPTRLPRPVDARHSGVCTLECETASGSGEMGRKANVQICLVDCPGHASLIKTIIGGAQIIDLVLLVVDATKGIQTQTAECLVVAELLARHLIVVLNKIDLFPEETRAKKVAGVTAKLRGVFAQTAFGADVPIVPVAANPDAVQDLANLPPAWNVEGVVQALSSVLIAPEITHFHANSSSTSRLVDRLALQQRCTTCPCCRTVSSLSFHDSFYLVFDHCFALKGKGTVLTGTVLSGRVKVGDSVVVLSASAGGANPVKVRSLQTFKRNVESAGRGQRVAMCVSSVDASSLERGAICDPQHVPPAVDGCIAIVERIRFFKPPIGSGAKFHCTVGHTTILCTAHFFAFYESDQTEELTIDEKAKTLSRVSSVMNSASSNVGASSLNTGRLIPSVDANYESPNVAREWPSALDLRATYRHQEELTLTSTGIASSARLGAAGEPSRMTRKLSKGVDASCGSCEAEEKPVLQYALLVFEKPIVVPPRSIFICSKLDMDASSPMCRLAFFGQMLEPLSTVPSFPAVSATPGMYVQRPSQAAKKPSGSSVAFSSSAASSPSVRSIFHHPAVLSLPVYKWKHKVGGVERFIFEAPADHSDDTGDGEARSLIGRGLFKSPQHISRFIGFRVAICRQQGSDTQVDDTNCEPRKQNEVGNGKQNSETRAGLHGRNPEGRVTGKVHTREGSSREARVEGRIEKAFGNKGKFVVELATPIKCSAVFGSGKGNDGKAPGFLIHLDYKKKVYDKAAQFSQDVRKGEN